MILSFIVLYTLYIIFKDTLLNCLYIIWPVCFVVNNVYRICITVRPIIYVWPIWLTWRCLVRCRNCLPFASTCIHPGFLVGSVLPIFLVLCGGFCVSFAFPRPMSLVCPKVVNGSGFSILDLPFGFLWRLFIWWFRLWTLFAELYYTLDNVWVKMVKYMFVYRFIIRTQRFSPAYKWDPAFYS